MQRLKGYWLTKMEAEAAVHEFYYMLRNKTKHGEHSEAETQTLENIRADFYRLFKNFFPE